MAGDKRSRSVRTRKERLPGGGVATVYPITRALKGRPADANDAAVRAITLLYELSGAGAEGAVAGSLLHCILGHLRCHVIEGSEAGYFADRPLEVESLASVMLAHLERVNGGVRPPPSRAKATARLLSVVVHREHIDRAALDRISSAAAKALGPQDPGDRFVRASAVRRIEEAFEKRLRALDGGTDAAAVAHLLARDFYLEHSRGWVRTRGEGLAAELLKALRIGVFEADTLVNVCQRYEGIKGRLHNFKDRKPRAR